MCVIDKKRLLHRVNISYDKLIHFQVCVFVVVVVVVIVVVVVAAVVAVVYFSTLRKCYMFCFVLFKSYKSLKHNFRRDRLINHHCSQKVAKFIVCASNWFRQ